MKQPKPKQKIQNIQNHLTELPFLELTSIKSYGGFVQEQTTISARSYDPRDVVELFDLALNRHKKLMKEKKNAKNPYK